MFSKKSILLIVCFIGFNTAIASTLTVTEDIPLVEQKDTTYRYSLFSIFEEENPGVLSDKYTDHGCTLFVSSNNDVLPQGTYEVIEDEKSSPDFWDNRWYRNIKLQYADGEFSVSCKTNEGLILNPINRSYISKVSGGTLILQ